MNRRSLTGAALATTVALSLAACGGSTGSGAESGNSASSGAAGGELTLAGWSLASTPEFQTLADAFNASNSGYTVVVKEYDATNYDTQMTADLAAGTAPDLYPIKNQRSFYT